MSFPIGCQHDVLCVCIRKAQNIVNSVDLFHYLNVSYSMLSLPHVHKLVCTGNSDVSSQNKSIWYNNWHRANNAVLQIHTC